MKTSLIPQSDPAAIKETLKLLQAGGVVGLPTDTVYGLACSASDTNAIQSIYQIKIRESLKAIPVLIADLDQLKLISGQLNENALKLAQSFWPGAMTLIVNKLETLPSNLSPYPTVGVRLPDHNWLRSVIRAAGPLAATSANISGEANPVTAQDVLDQLGDRIGLVIDGGKCEGGIPSTVVDCSGEPVKILREGGILPEQIFSVLSNKTGTNGEHHDR